MLRWFESTSSHQKPVTKKMSQAFFFAVSSKIDDFANQFLDAVLQCCPTILVRFSQLDAHFPCRFLEFGRGGGNFFEKKQNKSCCFLSECFQFPAANFPLAAIFSFFAVAGKMETARTFIPFPIMRMCRPACRRAKRCSGPFLERKSLHGLIGRKRGLYHPLRGWLMRRASACIRLAGTGR